MPIKVERSTIPACCQQVTHIFVTDQPMTKEVLAKLVEKGFNEAKHFTEAGILYADNDALIVTGPIGSNKLQIRCKIRECEPKLNEFEELLSKLE